MFVYSIAALQHWSIVGVGYPESEIDSKNWIRLRQVYGCSQVNLAHLCVSYSRSVLISKTITEAILWHPSQARTSYRDDQVITHRGPVSCLQFSAKRIIGLTLSTSTSQLSPHIHSRSWLHLDKLIQAIR